MFNETFEVEDFTVIKEQLLIWASQFSSCSFLDNHQYTSKWQLEECLVAAGALHQVTAAPNADLSSLQQFIDDHDGEWIFGHLCYDALREEDGDQSSHFNNTGFAVFCFYVPETLFRLSAESIAITTHKQQPVDIWRQVTAIPLPGKKRQHPNISLRARISREAYLLTIARLKEHIHRGDCYEINFCQEFYANDTVIDPVALYQSLSRLSPNPFSCYHKSGHSHLVCASPERFIARTGDRVFSQPIKGTAPRNLTDLKDDEARLVQLQQNKKERSENVMVVDLVRNDLSRICREGTVRVDELFKVYSYPQVHQLISTVSGALNDEISFTDIIKATFPMGSMTGAPKKRVMELIERYETGRRGLFSGAVGYINPAGDFDFNVVIRSLLYNGQAKYLSYWVGGGITWYSNAEAEYEECLLKASAIKKVLQPAAPSE